MKEVYYVGNAYTVACKSKATADFPEYPSTKIPAGWKELPGYLGGALGKDADVAMTELLAKAKRTHVVSNGLLLIPDETNFWVSADGCYSFTNWSLQKSLPTDVVVKNLPAYEQCEEGRIRDTAPGIVRQEPVDSCKYFNFFDEGQPIYKDIKTTQEGSISFMVNALAIDGQELVVSSKDRGKNWETKVIGIKSGTIITDTDGQTKIEMRVAEPRKVVTIEVRTRDGGILPLYDMGEIPDRELGDGMFSNNIPAWLTQEELTNAMIVVGYSDGYRVERAAIKYK